MARVSTYLNFPGTTEPAFEFYRSVFGTAFSGPIHRMGEAPAMPGQPPLSDADKQRVMHVELPILAGHVLMGTDAPDSPRWPKAARSRCRCRTCSGARTSAACATASACSGCSTVRRRADAPRTTAGPPWTSPPTS